MRIPFFRALPLLVVTTALAACGDAPTGPDTRARAGSASPGFNTGSALSIAIGSCSYDYCRAEASGGTGSGYSFTWHNAVNIYEDGNLSLGDPNCGSIRGYISVGVTVTDSSGATAPAYREVNCPGGDIATY